MVAPISISAVLRPPRIGKCCRSQAGRRPVMIFSHTQISRYLRCPRSYRYRYLDGWHEKETRASLLFGRAFEKALAAFFSREDSAAALFKEWGAYRGGNSSMRMETIGSAWLDKVCSCSKDWR